MIRIRKRPNRRQSFLTIIVPYIFAFIVISTEWYLGSEKSYILHSFWELIENFDYQQYLSRGRNINTNKSVYLTDLYYFNRRLYNIEFLQDYSKIMRNAKYSIMISTFERTECLKRSFSQAFKNRPVDTEIVICDDASKSPEKQELLTEIAEKYYGRDVYVIRHRNNSGAFHTKLDGFLFCIGSYLMSLDDDDTFNETFYQEIAANVDQKYDFIIPLNLSVIFWLEFPVLDLSDYILYYHNHYTYAFRRSLMKHIDYPNYSIRIVRDDSVLMIPMYINTKMKKVKYFQNTGEYFHDGFCKNTSHESHKIDPSNELVINGKNYLLYFVKTYHKGNDFAHLIEDCYQQHDPEMYINWHAFSMNEEEFKGAPFFNDPSCVVKFDVVNENGLM
ncbi:hypothetical protein TRFO_11689 [Tritrichomonas foetus]|uniref:Glycosyltransferase 2-like domain-containing protein n=1 Tax=Tritrichomonas foetus TaxID=1144522 RepID=A0A1J4J4P6_9EUKA|nr:hypothetical protein TRFO_11689 [Tritrichomonas foetus]|eukprot:OHS93673.1 hypothetical protein TRFO_11689 [Tritrichomonas foetus]